MEIELWTGLNKLREAQEKRMHTGTVDTEMYESVASCILDMMLEKTKLYGGMFPDEDVPFKERVLRVQYEGIGRKATRLPALVRNIVENNDVQAQVQYLDTLVDIAGYAIMGIAELAEDIQRNAKG